jgi:hypothetical protein
LFVVVAAATTLSLRHEAGFKAAPLLKNRPIIASKLNCFNQAMEKIIRKEITIFRVIWAL